MEDFLFERIKFGLLLITQPIPAKYSISIVISTLTIPIKGILSFANVKFGKIMAIHRKHIRLFFP